MHTRTLITAVLAVAAALVLPSAVLDATPRPWQWLATFQPGTLAAAEGALRTAPRGDRDIVVLGSSVAQIDVDDVLLSRMLDRQVVPAGVMGSAACWSAMLAPEIIARQPTTVVLPLSPGDIVRCASLAETAFDARVALRSRSVWALVSDPDLLAAHLGDWSALFRHRRVRTIMRNGRGPGWAEHPRDRMPLAGRQLRRLVRQRARGMRQRGDLGTQTDSTRAIRALAERLTEHDIELVLLPSPVHPRVVSLATGGPETCWTPGHAEHVQALAAEIGAAYIGPEDLGGYTTLDFMDPIHLEHNGQERYTRAIAAALR